jgi:hypothetical protein
MTIQSAALSALWRRGAVAVLAVLAVFVTASVFNHVAE